jgi:hypothetical protein
MGREPLQSPSMTDAPQPEQKTKAGESIEKPVPTRRGFFGAIKKAAQDAVVKRTSTKG